jgi:hypothetical protein
VTGRRAQAISRLRLVLVALPVLALADVPLRGVDGTVDLLVVLMVGVALGEPRYLPARTRVSRKKAAGPHETGNQGQASRTWVKQRPCKDAPAPTHVPAS